VNRIELETPSIDRVVLVGFMGAGKTTVGRLLADRLGWDFRDTDALVEQRLGRSVGAIFREFGEDAFRTAECEMAKQALADRETVVSTGGGWAEPEGRMESLSDTTLSVWLSAPLEEMLERVREHSAERPLLGRSDASERARSLLERRKPRYARAKMHLNTSGRDPAALADAIARRVRDQAPSERPKTT